MSYNLLKGKRGIIFGALNEQSIAWKVAEKAVEDKIIYSCHVGGITASSFKRGYAMIWSDIAKIEAGEKPEHIVNRWDV